MVVTGDTWDQSSIFVDAARRNGGAVINVFNIDKINKDAGRIKKLNEYVGDSYFNFLASLPDLVLIMDEAHTAQTATDAGANASRITDLFERVNVGTRGRGDALAGRADCRG